MKKQKSWGSLAHGSSPQLMHIHRGTSAWLLVYCAAADVSPYRHNTQQYLLILIDMYGTWFISWHKNDGRSKILNWGRGTLWFCVLLCCVNELEYFWTYNSCSITNILSIEFYSCITLNRPLKHIVRANTVLLQILWAYEK